MAADIILFLARVFTRRLKNAEKILDQLRLKPSKAFNMLLARIELRKEIPFEANTHPKPLLSSNERAAVWTEALGAYWPQVGVISLIREWCVGQFWEK